MQRPPKLLTFLEFGGDLSTFPGIEGLAEAVVARRRLNSAAQNEAEQAFFIDCVEHWLRSGPQALDDVLAGGYSATQAAVTAFAWAAECYADPEIAERFERALPTELWLEHLTCANERKARSGS